MLSYKKIKQDEFRHVIGHFSSGVSVITTAYEGEIFGLTASALSSVSLTPPTLLICVNKDSGTEYAITESKRFNVNILSSDQGKTAKNFATPGINKFKNVDYSISEHEIPFLDDNLITLECVLSKKLDGGTHSIFLAEVQDAWQPSNTEDTLPLVYYRGQFGDFYNHN